jgi:hypothetical protein
MNAIVKICFLVVFITEAMRSAAFAQAANPQACAPQSRDSSSQTLSDKLNQSNGVLCPPDVDPAMKAPTPHSSDQPVIPPPGSPGGNPNVQPK